MFQNNIDPVLFHLGPFEIRYYGIIFVLGFIIAYYIILHLGKDLKITRDDVSDLIFYQVIGVILGARIFYILFYNLSYFISNPLKMFAVWNGGLSFHGGFAGAIIALFIFCRKKNINFLDLADIMVIPTALALCFGRIANYLNGELVGRVTNVPWCVEFKDFEGCRHPSQIYESAKNLLIFFTLWSIKGKKLPRGTLLFTFIFMYSILRFFIEYVRAPDPQLGFIILGLTMGQLLNIAMFIISGIFLVKVYFYKQKTSST